MSTKTRSSTNTLVDASVCSSLNSNPKRYSTRKGRRQLKKAGENEDPEKPVQKETMVQKNLLKIIRTSMQVEAYGLEKASFSELSASSFRT